VTAETFIYRYTGGAEAYLVSVSELVRKVLKRGLLMLQDLPGADGITEATSAVVLLFRHALALIDAVAELSRLPSVEGFKIIFRSFLETKCYIEYILESDMPSRAVAYQTYHMINKIRQYEQYDGSTRAGKRYYLRLQQDRLFGPQDQLNIDTGPAIANLQEQLSREPYRSASEKLLKDARLNWYSIDGGPKNMRELCDHLHCPIAYDQLYVQLSPSVHGTGVYVDTFYGEHVEGQGWGRGEGQMHALRAMSGFQDLINIVLPMMLDLLRQSAAKILPNHIDRLARFYRSIFKPFYNAHVANVVVKVSR
jgi:hypothetical protein